MFRNLETILIKCEKLCAYIFNNLKKNFICITFQINSILNFMAMSKYE